MTNISIGATVRYLNEVGGGTITRIISPTMVEILDESGFEIPVPISELLIVNQKSDTEKVEIAKPQIPEPEPITYIEGNDQLYIALAFVPTTKHNERFTLFVINDSNYWISYLCAQTKVESHAQNILETGTLEPNTKLQLTQLTLLELHEIKTIHFQAIIYNTEDYKVEKPISEKYNVEHTKFYKSGIFQENMFFDENAYIIDLHNATHKKIQKSLQKQDIQKLKSLKQLGEKRPRIQQKRTPKEEMREVDLHIHELVEDENHMSSAEKLSVQLAAFETALTQAIQDRIPKLVYIHGVGNGILKSKIRSILDKDYPQFFYQDASFQRYKFGATLVYLEKIHS